MTDTWVRTFLIAANLLLFLIMGAAALFLNWSGPGFCLGFIVGAVFFFSYFRIKQGYWP